MKLLTIIYFVVLICSLSVAQDGIFDTGFGSGGIVITPDGYASCIKIQTDGKIVIGGDDSNDMFTTVRYNKDGTLDNTYGTNGIIKTFLSINGSRMHSSALFPGNKIIQAGIVNLYTDNKISVLVRYDSIGNRDYTFGNNGVVFHDVINGSEHISKVIVQPDEKILISGYSLSQGFVFRCYSNGDIDSTFGINGYIFPNPFIFITSMVLQPDGKFVITGNSMLIPNTQVAVARFNPDGYPDSSFGLDGKILTNIETHLQIINSLVLQPDGKIIFAGERLSGIGESLEYVFIRFNSDGSLDNSFGINGIVHFIPYGNFNFMTNTSLQSDGKLLMSGGAVLDSVGSGRSGMFLMRFKQNGEVDTTFGNNGFFITPPELQISTGREFEVQKDHKIVLTGNANGNFVTARINVTSLTAIDEIPDLKLPNDFILEQNYPNPFNPTTIIKYQIPELSFVKLKVFDVLGNEIVTLVTEEKEAGNYDIDFNASTLSSGVYFYRLQAGDFVQTRKMILIK